MNAIFRRRSIRKYTSDVVSNEVLHFLLEAAMCAPSAQNQRPWHFVVIQDRAMLTTLANVSPYAKMVKDAPVVILVCGDLERELAPEFWVQDCAAAAENLLIEAEDRHLGAVWVGIYPRKTRVEYIKNVLHLPEHIIPFALVPLGYPAEEKTPLQRYDESRVHYNQW